VPNEALTRARLVQALRRLAALAAAEGLVLELALYGGAVFTLVYHSRAVTKDVDGVLRPAAAGRRLARRVAAEQDLPEDWLNDDVRQFLSPHGKRRAYPGKEFAPGLTITIPTAAYLLALKLNSCRQPLPGDEGDEADIRFLLRKVRPASVSAMEEIHHRFFPGDGLSDRALDLVEEFLKDPR